MINSDLLTTKEAAAYLGLSVVTLEIRRSTGRHSIPFVTVGRLVKYRKAALDNFLEQRTYTATGSA